MATGISAFLSERELRHLHRLTLNSRYVVEGSLAGRHRSHLRGISSEFADHRAYNVGDDPRHIDWKVLGRTDRYFVRRFEDETILRVYLLVDRSASMAYGSGSMSKYTFACKTAMALGYVAAQAQDAVGLFIYSKDVDAVVPARGSLTHLNDLGTILHQHKPASSTATARAMHRVAEAVQRRAMIVLLSDLLDDPETVIRGLAHFRRQNHDVIVIHTLDPVEIDLAPVKAGRFRDMETGETVVADPSVLAAAYRQAFGEFLDTYRRSCLDLGADYRLLQTNQAPDELVRGYLHERWRSA